MKTLLGGAIDFLLCLNLFIALFCIKSQGLITDSYTSYSTSNSEGGGKSLKDFKLK